MDLDGARGDHLGGAIGDRAAFRLERGATVEPDGSVSFAVWAPRHPSLTVRLLDLDGGTRAELPMRRDAQGVHRARAEAGSAPVGSDYVFVVPGVGARPDPVSRCQPDGVHGPSRIVAPAAFRWNDAGWTGLPRSELVFYELHVGTFTPEGTFAAVAQKLPYLRDLGVSAVELMPVAAFPGARNWGYDGVFPYAPHAAYGGVDGLKALVDACHAHGLALFLDVVYNHLGPEGNYLGVYGPYFSDRYRTPWGDALNFDGPDSDEVRRYFIDNALAWLTEYHVDGLRLDAIHGIFDFGARHLLADLAEAFHAEGARLGRQVSLIAESDLNDPRVIRPPDAGGWGLDAQWSDDFHHSLHALLTGARLGYFGDFGAPWQLAKAITEGFVYDGEYAPHRRRRHGASAAADPGDRFVACIQNHDQVANGYQGRRLARVAGVEKQKVGAAVLFSSPVLPLLFQGEEYGEDAPFDYFTSHADAALVEAVRVGRHAEYQHLLEEGVGIEVWTDPQDPSTFERSKLRWSSLDQPPHAETLVFYRALIALRRRLLPLRNGRKDLTRVAHDPGGRWFTIHRGDPSGAATVTAANLGDEPASVPLPADARGWRLALATAAAAVPTALAADAHVVVPPATAFIFESGT